MSIFSAKPYYRSKHKEQPATPPRFSEIRCYRVPDFILEEEQEMLRQLDATDWKDLFYKVHDQLYTTIFLLKHFDDGEEVDGYTLNLIGETLGLHLDMLSRLCSIVSDFDPVEPAET